MEREILCVLRDLINKKFTRNIANIGESTINENISLDIWLPEIGVINSNANKICRLSFRIKNSCLREILRDDTPKICIEIADPQFIDTAINLITKEIRKIIDREIKNNQNMINVLNGHIRNFKSLLRRNR